MEQSGRILLFWNASQCPASWILSALPGTCKLASLVPFVDVARELGLAQIDRSTPEGVEGVEIRPRR